MGVGILISSYHCTWEFWYLITIVHAQRFIWSSTGVGFLISSYHCTHSRSIWSFTGVELLISSYHCTHPWEFWTSMGVGILISSEHCTHSKVNLKFHGCEIFFDIFFRPLYTLKGEFEVPWGWEFWCLPTIAHSKVNLKFMGFPMGRQCDHREGVRSCAIRRPALHKRSCTIRKVAYLQSGWYRIAVGHTMNSKGARTSVNVECDVVGA